MSDDLKEAAALIEEYEPELLESLTADDEPEEDNEDEDDESEGEYREAARSQAPAESSDHDVFEPYRPSVTPEQVAHASTALQQEYAALAQQFQHIQAVTAQIPWDQLRAMDPARWVLHQQQYEEAMQQLQARANAFQQARAGLQATVQHEQSRNYQHTLKIEDAKVRRRLGDAWNPETKAEIAGYLQDLGYSNEQIRTVSARDVLLAYNALQAERGEPEAPAPRKAKRRGPTAMQRAEAEIKHRNVRGDSLRAGELRIAALLDDNKVLKMQPRQKRGRISNAKVPGGLTLKQAAQLLERAM